MSRRVGRPRGATRERILDIALELFTERGYDKTSLREIADQLGFTKAALYYHFEHKEDILLALHMRLHALGRDVLDRVDGIVNADDSLGIWVELLDAFIDEVAENRKLFLLHFRNRNAFEGIEHSEDNSAEHEDLEEKLNRFLSSPSIPAQIRVRMACSIGAVVGALLQSSEAFEDVASEDLAAYVRDAVHDLLGIGASPRRQTAPRRPPRSPRGVRR